MNWLKQPTLKEYYGSSLNEEDEDLLEHYGRSIEDGAPGRGSGRYPLGSGDDPNQRSGGFLSRIDSLKKEGMSEREIAGALGILGDNGKPSVTRLRAQISIATEEQHTAEAAAARRLREHGYSLNQIAEKMGYKNDSSVRSLLNNNYEFRLRQSKETAEFLKEQVKNKGMIDIGTGVEKELKITKEKLDKSVERLRMEGYEVYKGRVPQATNPGKFTTIKVLCPPGTEHKEIFEYGDVHSVKDYISPDGGETFQKKFTYPASMDSKRLQIRYGDKGGLEKDGVIELRRGVQDLSLGNSKYAQVRILVDGTHYLKGMAVYSDDMPKGVDVIFNTNKKSGTPMTDVLKKIKDDPDNPFGSAIKDADKGGQYWYTDKTTGEKKLGLINKRADEGDWSAWKDKLPSQFLSKQPLALAKRQLKLAMIDKQNEYEEICSLTNPTVKKKMLETFSNDCDSAAVHLYAAALPRQKYHVILPFPKLKENEVYAPNYENGEKVALIRYPHGGTFEIPILTVNNRYPVAKKLLGNVTDAVGINSKVAERLSGADFDGDTVMVIPTNDKVKIKSTKQLKGLEGFDPKTSYGTEKREDGYYNSAGKKIKVMANTQNEMGRISNLITDMTLQGANSDELARAVRHSMVVIDAEKHKLDYKQSEKDNNIAGLKKAYQTGGASTLISRAKSETSVIKRQGSPKVNMKNEEWYDPSKPEGALIYKNADNPYHVDRKVDRKKGIVTLRTEDGKKIEYSMSDKNAHEKYNPVEKKDPKTGEILYTDKSGKITYRKLASTQKSSKMAETDDAFTLISDANTDMERAYATYANKMKSLANSARKEMVTTGRIKYSAAAKKTYQNEVDSLMKKLNEAAKNAPRERRAQLIANSEINAKKKANPDMTNEEIKKLSQLAMSKAREAVGAKRVNIEITDKEWEAIQKGAISENNLIKILNNTDIDVVRQKATPRQNKELSKAKVNTITMMNNRGYTRAEIAKKLGVSVSTVNKYLKGEV